ncbi:hypothetical protein MSG28_003051 [Choristoneura fumiferana]|uniref:Uncharacterized protein n=1 Tax=Choristoneura fumiferana TaxID=7141 RepID=A0ACC0JKN8_CHOFU|nr:hypothetical protein MSG28_003051 [Choristoneura fumiferana]
MTLNASKGWSHSDGYLSSDNDVYPKRGRSNGIHPDLTVFLKEDPLEWSNNCITYNSGYKLYLHHPADVPQHSLYYFSAHYDQTVSYFLAYTPNNCRLECLSNYTFNRCGCVMHHMPQSFADKEGHPGTEVEKCQCYPLCNEVQYGAETLKTKFDFDRYLQAASPTQLAGRCVKTIQEQDGRWGRKDLECKPRLGKRSVRRPPTRWTMTNDGDVKAAGKMQAVSNRSIWRSLREAYVQQQWSSYGIKYTHLEFYHKEPRFVSMRRSELFGLTDFLANCGGLLGLFLGFSFLSLVEIFYFCTLRGYRLNNWVTTAFYLGLVAQYNQGLAKRLSVVRCVRHLHQKGLHGDVTGGY